MRNLVDFQKCKMQSVWVSRISINILFRSKTISSEWVFVCVSVWMCVHVLGCCFFMLRQRHNTAPSDNTSVTQSASQPTSLTVIFCPLFVARVHCSETYEDNVRGNLVKLIICASCVESFFFFFLLFWFFWFVFLAQGGYGSVCCRQQSHVGVRKTRA